jgi:hypothetical protein
MKFLSHSMKPIRILKSTTIRAGKRRGVDRGQKIEVFLRNKNPALRSGVHVVLGGLNRMFELAWRGIRLQRRWLRN